MSNLYNLLKTIIEKLNATKDTVNNLPQPDWNENDETKLSYIKNRPFYSETGNVTIKNATHEVLERFPVFAVGDTVTVNVDGVEHSLVAYDDGGLTSIGDTGISLGNGEGQLGWQIFVDGDEVVFHSLEPHTVSYLGIDYHHKIDEKYLPDSVLQFKPNGNSYLTFSSLSSFTLEVYDTTKHWNGTLEYFASDKTWTIWDGTSSLSAVADNGEYFLYLRGTGNTVITGNNKKYRWIIYGDDVKCIGNIENLLDYATVESGRHPMMAAYCYAKMFQGCIGLTQAPSLPATTLANSCYANMFQDCDNLTQAPSLRATTLANNCYGGMFKGCKNLTQAPYLLSMTLVTSCYANMFQDCTSLTQAPSLPATTLASSCYASMFSNCTSLTQAPFLPATTLANSCYSGMFQGCISLTQAPSLRATTLANSCYGGMFRGCISLTQAPSLPATTLAEGCYASMFSYCLSLTQAPSLPATTLANGCYAGMFQGCTSLTQAPSLRATTLANSCYGGMFQDCTSLTQVPFLPATTLANDCYSGMFQGCKSLKLSSTKTGEYIQEYRIPSSGNGTTVTNALVHMFISTGGSFAGEPKINKTYYLSTNNMIVRETEIATLNGYVRSIINAMA